ncbi:MAG: hypothetical protein ACI81I_000722 [Arcobacteraceae bacterium]|jgi:hypothetical protein
MSSILKNTHYFPHPANLRNDRRMKRAMADLPGGVGYGAILLLMEVLRNEPNYVYPMQDLDLLSHDLGISLPILQTVVSSYDFFELTKDENEEVFISPMLNQLMEPFLQKKKQNSIAGQFSAKKRKIKQDQQLQQLSRFDSSQHVFNTPSTYVQEKRKEYNRKEEKREEDNLSILDFQIFKTFIINKYKNKIVCHGPDNYLDTTSILVTALGYLRNSFTNKDLTPTDAKKVWQWLFENQNQIENIY